MGVVPRFVPPLPPKAIIAHRGASAYSAENTLTAFRAAAALGAHAIELDVKRTRDGRVVVMHDATVDRTARHGRGAVRALTYAQLQAFNVGPHARPERIPTLEEVLDAVGRRLLVNIELTNYDAPTDDLPWRVARIVRQWGYPERVWVSSFNPVALWRFGQACPEVSVGYLTLPRRGNVTVYRLLARWLPHAALHPHRRQVDAPWVRAAFALGRRVFPYTVNAYPALRATLARAWVDGVFTDRPDVALQARAQVLASLGGQHGR